MRDNKKVKTIIETSKSLEPLLHPAKYKSIFSKINTSSDGHITLEEFSKFIDDVEQVAKKEEKDILLVCPNVEIGYKWIGYFESINSKNVLY